MRQGIRFTAAVTMAYSAAVWLLTLAFPGPLIRIFNDDPELIADGIPAFRIYFATFGFMSCQFIGSRCSWALAGPKARCSSPCA